MFAALFTSVSLESFHQISSSFSALDRNTYDKLVFDAEQAIPALPFVSGKEKCGVQALVPKLYISS